MVADIRGQFIKISSAVAPALQLISEQPRHQLGLLSGLSGQYLAARRLPSTASPAESGAGNF